MQTTTLSELFDKKVIKLGSSAFSYMVVNCWLHLYEFHTNKLYGYSQNLIHALFTDFSVILIGCNLFIKNKFMYFLQKDATVVVVHTETP